MGFKKWSVSAAALLALSACGDTLAEQGVIGAGLGTATAVVLDGNLFTGAVIGSAGNLIYCQTNPGRCN